MENRKTFAQLVSENSNGLFELAPPVPKSEYKGRDWEKELKTTTILIHKSQGDWIAFPGVKIPVLVHTRIGRDGDPEVLFLLEILKSDELVHFYLLLIDEVLLPLLKDETQHILSIHQLYCNSWEQTFKLTQMKI